MVENDGGVERRFLKLGTFVAVVADEEKKQAGAPDTKLGFCVGYITKLSRADGEVGVDWWKSGGANLASAHFRPPATPASKSRDHSHRVSLDDIITVFMETNAAKNEAINTNGHSPTEWVLGKKYKLPASITSRPDGVKVPAIHCLRAASGVLEGRNQVQGAPSRTACSG